MGEVAAGGGDGAGSGGGVGSERARRYWDGEFLKLGGEHYDWLVGTEQLLPLIAPLVQPPEARATTRVLVVGCGTSGIGPALSATCPGCQVTCTDISPVAIESMAEKTRHSHPGVVWVVADALDHESHADDSYDAIVDKGTSDTFQFRYRNREWLKVTRRMYAEMGRLLAPGGCYLVITPKRNPRGLRNAALPWTAEPPLPVEGERFRSATAKTEVFLHVCRRKE